MKFGISASILSLTFAGLVYAEDPRQACEAMYPIESFEEAERQQYINECVQTKTSSSSEDTEGLYEGTVEDFVESIPEDSAD